MNSVTVSATPEELAGFKSTVHYRIADLMLEVHRRFTYPPSLEFYPIIGITEITEGKTSTVEVLQNEMDVRKEILEQSKKVTVIRREVLLTTIEAIRQNRNDWKVQASARKTYQVSGFGLGWLDNKLDSGQWIFRSDTKQMTPVDKEGIALASLLIAN